MRNLFLLLFFFYSFCANSAYAQDKESHEEGICKSQTYDMLYDGMSSGDYQSLIYFVRCFEYHDGGNAGDLFREAGAFIVKNPAIYVYVLERENVPHNCLSNFFVMLSLDFVDNPKAEIQEIDRRLTSLRTVKSSFVRDIGIEELEKSKAFLMGVGD